MITGVHAILYSKHADSVRAFLDGVMRLGSVDAGGGWPIFAAPPAELAVHPTEGEPEHEIYFMCDDVHATIAELARQGIRTDPVVDRGWGLLTSIHIAEDERVGLYEPRHPTPLRPE